MCMVLSLVVGSGGDKRISLVYNSSYPYFSLKYASASARVVGRGRMGFSIRFVMLVVFYHIILFFIISESKLRFDE